MAEKKNEMIERLSQKNPVETARPEKTVKALQECVERSFIHIMFKETGTELGIQLQKSNCQFDKVDFENAKGSIHLEGGAILNYDKVRCIANINLATCEGTGYLLPVTDEEYNAIMGHST